MTQHNHLPKTNLDFSDVLACSFHDVKNSLELLACTLDRFTDELPDYPGKNEHLSCLQYEVKCISNTLSYMLTVYNFDHERYQLDIGFHSALAFIEEALTPHQAFARARGVQLDMECAPDLFWFFDHHLIAMVFDEALNNALRYTHDRIKVTVKTDEQYLYFHIEENGTGYPRQFLDSIASGENKLSLRGNRTGLGIHFANIIAQSHRGKEHGGFVRLSNDSQLGGGCFTIALP
jgi:K+-sensing histidine kinase KdpD